jgi:hypothetical protein
MKSQNWQSISAHDEANESLLIRKDTYIGELVHQFDNHPNSAVSGPVVPAWVSLVSDFRGARNLHF